MDGMQSTTPRILCLVTPMSQRLALAVLNWSLNDWAIGGSHAVTLI